MSLICSEKPSWPVDAATPEANALATLTALEFTSLITADIDKTYMI